MRKALIVGVDKYEHVGSLSRRVSDAGSVKSVVGRNADGTLNLALSQLATRTGATARVTSYELEKPFARYSTQTVWRRPTKRAARCRRG